MFGNFYNASIRSYIILLSELFSNIQVRRQREEGDVYRAVPISYVSKEFFIQKLNSAYNTAAGDQQQIAKINNIVPRMSLQLNDIMYDDLYKTGITNNKISSKRGKKQFAPVPYKFTFQLGIFTRYQDDMYQIIEQILPYFQPTFNCSIKELHKNDVTFDRIIPISIVSIIMDEQLEGDRFSQRRIEWTITLELQGFLYPGVSSLEGEIKTIFLDFNSDERELDISKSIESVDIEVDPDDTNAEDWTGDYRKSYGDGITEKTELRGKQDYGNINKTPI